MNTTHPPQKSLSEIFDEMLQRANAATPGPWEFHGQSSTFAVSRVANGVHRPRVVMGDIDRVKGEDWRTSCGGVVEMNDAKFIAAARSDVPKLVAVARYYRERLMARCDPSVMIAIDTEAAQLLTESADSVQDGTAAGALPVNQEFNCPPKATQSDSPSPAPPALSVTDLREFWINVFHDQYTHHQIAHNSKQIADNCAVNDSEHRVDCVHVREVPALSVAQRETEEKDLAKPKP